MVGVAAMAIGRAADRALVTYALGSCVGVSAFDPVARVGGMLHFLLPGPAGGTADAPADPFTFASTAIPALLAALGAAGAERHRLVVCAAGGAQMLAGPDGSRLGLRNGAMLREILAAHAVPLAAEDLGGTAARSMILDLPTGAVTIRTGPGERLLWPAAP